VYTSVEVVPVEGGVPIEVMPVEVMVPVETRVPEGRTRVTTPETVTAHASRLAGRADRKQDRQGGERDECQLFRTCKLVHGDASLSLSTLGTGPRSGRFTPGQPVNVLTSLR